jgi:hypothetical protein
MVCLCPVRSDSACQWRKSFDWLSHSINSTPTSAANSSEYRCLHIGQGFHVFVERRSPLHLLDNVSDVQYRSQLHQLNTSLFEGYDTVNNSPVMLHELNPDTGRRIVNSHRTAFAIVRAAK